MSEPVPIRVLHFDMKGMIPRAEFMIRLLPEIAAMHYNALLVEFEDKFPYRSLPWIVHPDAWSREEFAAFRDAARSNGLEIVPLVQCAGHLDYILKHDRCRHLREGDPPRDSTGEWCLADPSEPLEIFRTMVEEILEFFPEGRYFHIGADEYDCSHSCSRCGGRDRMELFLDHVLNCNTLVRAAGRKVLVWDDMFRRRDSAKLRTLLQNSVPCVWQYIGIHEEFIAGMCELAPEVWGASKIQNNPNYRGLGRQDAVMTNVDDWAEMHRRYPLTGHVATIWGRNQGLSPLAQTLPESFYMIGYQGRTLVGGKITDRTAFRREFARQFFGLDDMPWIDNFGDRPEAAAAGVAAARTRAARNREILAVWEMFNQLDCLWSYCDHCFGSDMALYGAYTAKTAPDALTFNFRDGVRITRERAAELRSRFQETLGDLFPPVLLTEYLASRLDGMLAVNDFWGRLIDAAIAGKKL